MNRRTRIFDVGECRRAANRTYLIEEPQVNHRQRIESAMQAAQTRSSRMQHDLHPVDDLLRFFQDYARARPYMVAATCLGVGFVVGWRLKPW
jgi:ElaB/YqjD/DUF883 family membrane-anchored ribosome-binding protein